MKTPLHDSDPSGNESVPMSRKALVGIAAASFAGTLVATQAIDEYREHRDEKSAEVNAEKTFETLNFEDIGSIRVVKAEAGPVVTYNRRKEPSLVLELHTGPGDEFDSRWVRKGGDKVEDYRAEVVWFGSNVTPVYTDAYDKRLQDGVAFIANDKSVPKDDIMSNYFSGSLDYEEPGTYYMTVPFNTSIQGQRTLELTPELNGYFLDESSETITEEDQLNGIEGQPIMSATVDIVGTQVYLDGVPLEEFKYDAPSK